jgi:hypothetical protein
MGQYHIPVNIDKREYVRPWDVGAGMKMVENIWNTGMPASLFVLLSCSHMRGGGDVDLSDEAMLKVAGRWAGDRIIVVGDYTEPMDPGTKALWDMTIADGCEHPWEWVHKHCTNIGLAMHEALSKSRISEDIGERWSHVDDVGPTLSELSSINSPQEV